MVNIAKLFACVFLCVFLEIAGCREVHRDPTAVDTEASTGTTDTITLPDSLTQALFAIQLKEVEKRNYWLTQKLKATAEENKIMGERIKQLCAERDSLNRLVSWNKNF